MINSYGKHINLVQGTWVSSIRCWINWKHLIAILTCVYLAVRSTESLLCLAGSILSLSLLVPVVPLFLLVLLLWLINDCSLTWCDNALFLSLSLSLYVPLAWPIGGFQFFASSQTVAIKIIIINNFDQSDRHSKTRCLDINHSLDSLALSVSLPRLTIHCKHDMSKLLRPQQRLIGKCHLTEWSGLWERRGFSLFSFYPLLLGPGRS